MRVPVPHKPKRKLGQNFLHDLNVIEKIVVYFQPQPSDQVLEIGAGTGALTSRIAPMVSRYIAVELDSSLIPYLETIQNVEIVHSDILDVNLHSLAGSGKLRIIGNLPYYISSPIFMRLLYQRHLIQDLTLMFQEEVAVRITAPPSDSEYGLLSVAAQYFFIIDKGFRISRNSFRPKPEIESRILRFVPRKETSIEPEQYVEFLQKSFSQRRKKLRNNLLRTLKLNPEILDQRFKQLGIGENDRAENLSPQLYEKLILALAQPY
jgi:16S rRNA (adenine1518-N6/adenine1519-N6)-dimethyltransferase